MRPILTCGAGTVFRTRVAMTIIRDELTGRRPPGYLLEPFGWARESVIAMLEQDTTLLSDLLYLSRIRMHLICLAIAHVGTPVPAELRSILFRGTAAGILNAVLGRYPDGLKRAVQRMPGTSLSPASYCALLALLDDPDASKLLYHADVIDDSVVGAVHGVPVGLRVFALKMQPWFDDMSSVTDGLQWLCDHHGLSFDDLATVLAGMSQPGQFIARLKSLIENLPLPDGLPPRRVLHARRLDSAAELRTLAKRWRNCLANYEWDVSYGRCAVYLWEHAGTQAACSVERCGRLGWCLTQVLGPQNVEIERSQLNVIVEAFEAAGVPFTSKLGPIQRILETGSVRELHRRRRRTAPIPEPLDVFIREFA